MRKFKQGQLKCNRELQEANDLLKAYKAMTGSVSNTFNDLVEQTKTLDSKLQAVAESKDDIIQLVQMQIQM